MTRKRQRTSRTASRSSVQTSPVQSRSPSPQPTDKKSRFEKRYDTANTSDADVLEKQRRTWTSSVYDHFEAPQILADGTSVRYVFVCKRHPSIKVSRARHDESTSNLVRHADHCEPADSQGARSIASFMQGSTYTPHKLRMKLALWVARRHHPYAIVADPELVEIFTDLNNKVIVPSPSTVSRDVREIYAMSRKKVAAILQSYPGKVHLCIDGWTSPNVISFIGLTVHWIVEGRVQSLILDFVKASKGHTGSYLAARVSECLHDHGIHNKILGITLDNASNNNTLVSELSGLLDGFQGDATRVRCFAHILNLVVKAILSQFSKSNKAIDGDPKDDEDNDAALSGLQEVDDDEEVEPEFDDDDDDEFDDAVDASDQAMVDEVTRETDEDAVWEGRLTREDVNLGRFSLSKVSCQWGP